MDLLLFVTLYTSCIGGCGYVFMSGDPDEPGIVNTLNRLLTRDLIDAIRFVLYGARKHARTDLPRLPWRLSASLNHEWRSAGTRCSANAAPGRTTCSRSTSAGAPTRCCRSSTSP
jgi:hypothetical protein